MTWSEADTDSTIQVTCYIFYLSFLDRENPGKHLHFYFQVHICGLSPVTAGFSIKIKGTLFGVKISKYFSFSTLGFYPEIPEMKNNQRFQRSSARLYTIFYILKVQLSTDVVTREQRAESMCWICPCMNSLRSYTHLTDQEGDIMTQLQRSPASVQPACLSQPGHLCTSPDHEEGRPF